MKKNSIILIADPELKDIVPPFIDKIKADIPNLWSALHQKDLATLEHLGHRLKGSSGGYGFTQLGRIGARIEMGAKARDYRQIELTLNELEDYFSRMEIKYSKAS